MSGREGSLLSKVNDVATRQDALTSSAVHSLGRSPTLSVWLVEGVGINQLNPMKPHVSQTTSQMNVMAKHIDNFTMTSETLMTRVLSDRSRKIAVRKNLTKHPV